MAPENQTATTPPATTPNPSPNVNVNVGADLAAAASNGYLGLIGRAKDVVNTSAVLLIAALLVTFIVWDRFDRRAERTETRAERAEDRALFREAIRDGNAEQNRRTGEVKGAVDKNTEVMRDLIAEFKEARRAGTIRSGAPVPPPSP